MIIRPGIQPVTPTAPKRTASRYSGIFLSLRIASVFFKWAPTISFPCNYFACTIKMLLQFVFQRNLLEMHSMLITFKRTFQV